METPRVGALDPLTLVAAELVLLVLVAEPVAPLVGGAEAAVVTALVP